MLTTLQKMLKFLPTLLLAFIMAVTVWISAVSLADPNDIRLLPRPVPIEIIGQDTGLLITNSLPSQVNLTLRAPGSVWNELTREQSAVRAVIDLSGLEAGDHTIPVSIQISLRPVKIVTSDPSVVDVKLESITTRTLPIKLTGKVEVAVGFEAEGPSLSQVSGSITGPESLVSKVTELQAALNISQASENIKRTIDLRAVDINNKEITGVTISPRNINVTQAITQRGGYRNVVVKAVLTGQIANGYRITDIAVFPPTVTVFSTDNKLVESLPGYVETSGLDITGSETDQNLRVPLSLIPGISVVGDPFVEVRVGVDTIEGSRTMEKMPVEIAGVPEGIQVNVSPETVDVILSGPLPLLDTLKRKDLHLSIDLSSEGAGTYQRIPRVELSVPDIRVESILPGSIEITLVSIQTPPVQP